MKLKHKKSKHATVIRDVYNDNVDANKCKLIQDFLETETVVQLPISPDSPDSSPRDFFLFTLLKYNPRRQYESGGILYSAIFQCLQGGPIMSTYLHSEPGFYDQKLNFC